MTQVGYLQRLTSGGERSVIVVCQDELTVPDIKEALSGILTIIKEAL